MRATRSKRGRSGRQRERGGTARLSEGLRAERPRWATLEGQAWVGQGRVSTVLTRRVRVATAAPRPHRLPGCRTACPPRGPGSPVSGATAHSLPAGQMWALRGSRPQRTPSLDPRPGAGPDSPPQALWPGSQALEDGTRPLRRTSPDQPSPGRFLLLVTRRPSYPSPVISRSPCPRGRPIRGSQGPLGNAGFTSTLEGPDRCKYSSLLFVGAPGFR